VCRPLAFRLLDATLRWRVDARETIAAFADELDPTDDARRLRTAIDPSTPLLSQMLRDADTLLLKARAVIPDAAGLVLCDDRPLARARGGVAAHDRRREAGRGGQRRAAGTRPDRPLRARRRERAALARRGGAPLIPARRLRAGAGPTACIPPGRAVSVGPVWLKMPHREPER
jgi:hypothetical protein